MWVGQQIEVQVGGLDEEGKRLSLSLGSEKDTLEDDDYRKHLAGSGKKSSGSFGTLGDILREKMEKK